MNIHMAVLLAIITGGFMGYLIGEYSTKEAVYEACRSEGWYLIQGTGDLYNRRALSCDGWNGQEVEDAARAAFTGKEV